MVDIILPDPIPTLTRTEVEINRNSTLYFIAADPVHLSLIPQIEDKTAGGGKKYTDGVPRAQQVFRLIPQQDVMPSIQTPDGIQLTPTFVLMGLYDAVLERWDKFDLNGHKYQIVSPVRPEHTVENRYFTKADVARR